MPFATSQGRPLYYERHGQGPAVLFLHGAGSNAATWWQQLPAFSARHTCITMDIRCFGRSPAPLDEFTLALFVADALAVLDQEGLARVAVVGQSLGGMVGLRLALQHPARVAALVACDSSLAIDHPELLERVARRLASTQALGVEQRSLGAWFLQHHPERAALYAQINHFNPSAHTLAARDWSAAVAALLEPANLLPTQALRDLACPTLLLVGSEDPLVPVSAMRDVAALVRGSECVVVPQAGHSAYFEKPVDFNRHVLDFLARRATFA
ncbi:alpha/beta fold hydrolase [Pseudorhodoferax sp. Leaf267]|uniref:alpha/beta fold hydrolase n=1 Tax=Pseudorhodoferax sp. Leaf267 TaxID=1736316 RepID=UPI0006FB3CF1|nr:alpha/beta fold hydrolase [Pseudorhodoferax sp. Leaf267]KQP17772.1 hypothetical protein ASF43_07810 [Pseudorhodoferax sp. Leaf267]